MNKLLNRLIIKLTELKEKNLKSKEPIVLYLINRLLKILEVDSKSLFIFIHNDCVHISTDNIDLNIKK